MSIPWAAGLFDGEGCVSVHREGTTSRFFVRMRVSMTNRTGVDRFREIVSLGRVVHEPRRSPRLDAWTWIVTKKSDVSQVLDLLRPHLVVKKYEADLAADFINAIGRPAKAVIFRLMRAAKSKPGSSRVKRKAIS